MIEEAQPREGQRVPAENLPLTCYIHDPFAHGTCRPDERLDLATTMPFGETTMKRITLLAILLGLGCLGPLAAQPTGAKYAILVGVLLACSPGERAYEHRSLQHGIFFHYLLEGLDGKARNDAGEITFGSLAEYVQRQVVAEVPKLVGFGAKQSLNLLANISGQSPTLMRVAAPVIIAEKPAVAIDPPSAIPELPRTKDLVGSWSATAGTVHISADGGIVLAFGVMQLKGTYTCTSGVLDMQFPDIGWAWRTALTWLDGDKAALKVVTQATTVLGLKPGVQTEWRRSDRPAPRHRRPRLKLSVSRARPTALGITCIRTRRSSCSSTACNSAGVTSTPAI